MHGKTVTHAGVSGKEVFLGGTAVGKHVCIPDTDIGHQIVGRSLAFPSGNQIQQAEPDVGVQSHIAQVVTERAVITHIHPVERRERIVGATRSEAVETITLGGEMYAPKRVEPLAHTQ